MRKLSLDDLNEAAFAVEAAADLTPGIDPWCSGLDWTIPTKMAFAEQSEPLILTWKPPLSDLASFALLALYRSPPQSTVLAGLEPMWGFASPILTPNPEAAMPYLMRYLIDNEDFDTIVLPGMPHPDRRSDLGARIVDPLSGFGPVLMGEGITRQIVDLTIDGSDHSLRFDKWLGRRSSRFRRNLKQAASQANNAGLCFEDVSRPSNPDLLFDRLLAIEHQTWKGQDNSGITSPEMANMYRLSIGRLAKAGRLRAHIAIVDGNDVGYIVGGVRARRYRGLQISYTQQARQYSVGNLLQAHQLHLLCESGEVDVYDMGMDMDYKRRWADRTDETVTFLVRGDTNT